MKTRLLLRVSFVAALAGGTLMSSCGGMLTQSIRDGLFNYVAGRVSSGADAAMLGDFITSVFTGGYGGSSDQ